MKNQKFIKTNKGFTLVELLITISIIGVLASIVLVSLNSARERARKASALSTVSSVMSELTMCAEDGGEATASAPNAGDPICCDDADCDAALAGHTITWPNIVDATGWSYSPDPAAGTSLMGSDYIFYISYNGDTISCDYSTNACQ